MSRKKPGPLTTEEVKTRVDVTIQTSNLLGDSSKKVTYGSVNCKKITVKEIIEEMENNSQSIASKELMLYVVQELSNCMMEKFKSGCAVELLDFGTIYPTLRGSISKGDAASKIKKHFDIGFTPSKKTKQAVENFEVGNVTEVKSQHVIYSVSDITLEAEEKNVLKQTLGRIKGKGIKMGGSTSGLYAVRVQKDFIENDMQNFPPRKSWIPIKTLIANLPSTVDFLLPDDIKKGTYIFIIETSLSAGGKKLKNSVLVKSEKVLVKGEKI